MFIMHILIPVEVRSSIPGATIDGRQPSLVLHYNIQRNRSTFMGGGGAKTYSLQLSPYMGTIITQ